MLDNTALEKLIEQQAQKEIVDKIQQTLTEDWFAAVEEHSIKFIQDRIIAKFSNSSAMPELLEAVKTSVRELFANGQLPGIDKYVDYESIKQTINNSTQDLIKDAVDELSVDPIWLGKIEQLISQQTVQRVLASLSTVDIRPIIKQSVGDTVASLKTELFKGIETHSKTVELTVLDQHVVVENAFTAKDITAVNSLTVQDLVVKGSINTDNQSWVALTNDISEKTFNKLNDTWQEALSKQVAEHISKQGIDFDNVKVDGVALVKDGALASSIQSSKLTSVGTLQSLTVAGDTNLNETVTVNRNRLGINTQEPDMALSLWDEEVAISAGKFKNQTGFIGTTRKQGLAIGVNKNAAIEINDTGLTTIKQVQIGLHKISHGNEVPNYSGIKGDVVFNADPTVDNPVFAWQCLGGFRWKVIRAVQ